LIEIKNKSYSEYLDLISRAKWMVTFGEGVDGYFLESVRSGAISFAVHNFNFFDERFDVLQTVYDSYTDMLTSLVDDILRLDNAEDFARLSQQMIALDKCVYNDKEYRENIKNYYLGNFTLPIEEAIALRERNIAESPLISIVMATYNGEKYLKEQLNSLNKLTYQNIEIIISDDSSTDATMDILRSHRFKAPVKVVENTGVHGSVANFGNALQYVQGKYFALCDQDDIWLPDKLEQLLAAIEDYDVVHGRVQIIGRDGSRHVSGHYAAEYEVDRSKQYRFSDCLFTFPVLGCASLIRASILDGLLPLPKKAAFHDAWIVLNAIVRGNGIRFLNEPVVKYRQHEENAAKRLYAKLGFQTKLLAFNKLITDELSESLSGQEFGLLSSHKNWCQLYGRMQSIMPDLSFEYFNSKHNQVALTNEAIETIAVTVKEILGEDEP
jgi:glycosyltransferase involved in cell wall biosynthesis